MSNGNGLNPAQKQLEFEVRTMLADHEDFRADNRTLVIGVVAGVLLYWSGRHCYEKKKRIMNGEVVPDPRTETKGWLF